MKFEIRGCWCQCLARMCHAHLFGTESSPSSHRWDHLARRRSCSAPTYEGHDRVKTVTRATAVTEVKPESGEAAATIGLIDCGHKANILRMMLATGSYHVRVSPAETPAAEIRNDGLKGLVV